MKIPQYLYEIKIKAVLDPKVFAEYLNLKLQYPTSLANAIATEEEYWPTLFKKNPYTQAEKDSIYKRFNDFSSVHYIQLEITKCWGMA